MLFQYSRHKHQVRSLVVSINRSTAFCHSHHIDFVSLEVSLLQNHLGTVWKNPFLGSGIRKHVFLHHFSGNRQFAYQRLILHIIHVRSNVFGFHLRKQCKYIFVFRTGLTFTCRHHTENNQVLIRNNLREHPIYSFHWYLVYNHAHHLIFRLYTRYRLLVDEITHIRFCKSLVFLLVTVVVCLFKLRKILCTATCIFSGSKSSPLGTKSLTIDSLQSFVEAVAFWKHSKLESLFRLCHNKLTIKCRSRRKRSIRLLSLFVQSYLKHHLGHIEQIGSCNISHRTLQRIRQGIIFEHNLSHIFILLLIRAESDNRLFIVGHREVNPFCRIYRLLNLWEQFLDLTFYTVHINVTHHNYTLQVRTIPLLIIVAQSLMRKIVHHFHGSYRKTVSVSAVWIYLWKQFLHYSHIRWQLASPFLMYNGTFLVYLLTFK